MFEFDRRKFRQLVNAVGLVVVVSFLSVPGVAADAGPEVDSKEYKILLRVERFADQACGVHQFWSRVVAVAGEIPLPVNGSMTKRKERRVQFLDTKDFDLRERHQHVFRIRTSLESDGTEKNRKKITLKYRGENI